MRKGHFIISLIVLMAMMVVPAFAKELKDMVFGKVPYTMAHAYHQAHVKHMVAYAEKKYGIEVKVIDGETTNDGTLAGVETFLSQGVDGIMVHCNDPKVMDQLSRMGHKANIPVNSFFSATASKIAPHTQINEAKTSKLMGIAAALKWKEWYPNKPIKIGVIDYLQYEIVQTGRTNPFIAGVMEIDPTAVVVSKLEGNGNIEQAMSQTQDMIQAHPDINIFYGASADHALGALAALEAAGRGKAVNGKVLTEIVVGTDATEAELIKVFDPSSSFKITQGLQPAVNGAAEVDLMVQVLQGKVKMDEYHVVNTYNKFMTYWLTTIDQAQEFLSYQYYSKFDLKGSLK
jgi:ABC-type sugar transport system substrate-binding protein